MGEDRPQVETHPDDGEGNQALPGDLQGPAGDSPSVTGDKHSPHKNQQGGRIMGNRRVISYVLFALAVVMLLVGVFSDQLLTGVLVGLAFALVGFVFLRRGK
jgi:hypothetical protein